MLSITDTSSPEHKVNNVQYLISSASWLKMLPIDCYIRQLRSSSSCQRLSNGKTNGHVFVDICEVSSFLSIACCIQQCTPWLPRVKTRVVPKAGKASCDTKAARYTFPSTCCFRRLQLLLHVKCGHRRGTPPLHRMTGRTPSSCLSWGEHAVDRDPEMQLHHQHYRQYL